MSTAGSFCIKPPAVFLVTSGKRAYTAHRMSNPLRCLIRFEHFCLGSKLFFILPVINLHIAWHSKPQTPVSVPLSRLS